MGKIRIKTLGEEDVEAEKKKGEKKEEAKKEEVSLAAEEKKEVKKKKEKFVKKKERSKIYQANLIKIDKNKDYPLSEALGLLKSLDKPKFDETVELHINTTEAGINSTVKLPHGTGKEVRVQIATDALLEEIEKGKISFDILIADPSMMPKLAKVARILGPKGLMPNPKAGTISSTPEEAAKKFQGGQVSFKTEAKTPVIHISVGKISFEDNKLKENVETIIKAVKRDRIRKVVIKSTMSPGINLQFN